MIFFNNRINTLFFMVVLALNIPLLATKTFKPMANEAPEYLKQFKKSLVTLINTYRKNKKLLSKKGIEPKKESVIQDLKKLSAQTINNYNTFAKHYVYRLPEVAAFDDIDPLFFEMFVTDDETLLSIKNIQQTIYQMRIEGRLHPASKIPIEGHVATEFTKKIDALLSFFKNIVWVETHGNTVATLNKTAQIQLTQFTGEVVQLYNEMVKQYTLSLPQIEALDEMDKDVLIHVLPTTDLSKTLNAILDVIHHLDNESYSSCVGDIGDKDYDAYYGKA